MAHLPLDQIAPSPVQPGLEEEMPKHTLSFEQNETEPWMGNYRGALKGLLFLIRH